MCSRGGVKVAQIFNLLYRRIAFCTALGFPIGSLNLAALPIANRRYSRLQICATGASAMSYGVGGWMSDVSHS
jgi:hypothetical protein